MHGGGATGGSANVRVGGEVAGGQGGGRRALARMDGRVVSGWACGCMRMNEPTCSFSM